MIKVVTMIISATFVLSAKTYAQEDFKTCDPRQYIVSVNVQNKTSREGLIKAWKLIAGHELLQSRFLSGMSEQIMHVVQPRAEVKNESPRIELPVLEELAAIEGVHVECDSLVGPNNEGSLFQ